MRRFFWLVILIILAGCALPRFKGDDFRDVARAPVSPEKATVYVYRVGQGTPVRHGAVMIYVDGQKVFHVRNKGFTWFQIAPGAHQFKAEWPWNEKPLFEEGHFDERFLTVNLAAGKTHFINYKIQHDTKPIGFAESMSLLGKAMTKSHVLSVKLVVEEEAEAFNNLESCGFQPNDLN